MIPITSSLYNLKWLVRTGFGKLAKVQSRGLERGMEGLSQKGLESGGQPQVTSPHIIQEDRLVDKIPQATKQKGAIPENLPLSHSALLAAMVTTAMALFTSGMVSSDKANVLPFFLRLPQTIESSSWRNQKREVKAFPRENKARPPFHGVIRGHDKDQADPLGGEVGGKHQEEETRPSGNQLVEVLSQEAEVEEDKRPGYEDRTTEKLPTLIVTVQNGDTLYGILKRRFGKSGKILMDAVRKLNPDIEDLDRIRVGQKIRLPVNLEVAYDIQTIRGGSDLSMERLDEVEGISRTIVSPSPESRPPPWE
jgi:hypothetical protein